MSLSLIVVAAVAVLLIAFDVWVVIAKGVKATISWQLLQAAKAWPILPFAFGVLFGHLFWENCGV
jgi:hypothetical protein